MKAIYLFIISFLIWSCAFGQAQIPNNTLKLGKPTTADKDIIFDINQGAANPRFRANGSAQRIEFTNDGVLYKALTSGGECPVRAVSTTDTATTADCQIHGTGTYTQTLYTPSNGDSICVKNAGTGLITLVGGGNIEDETSQELDVGVSLCLYGYNSNWFIK